jgi:hypothetical protein
MSSNRQHLGVNAGHLERFGNIPDVEAGDPLVRFVACLDASTWPLVRQLFQDRNNASDPSGLSGQGPMIGPNGGAVRQSWHRVPTGTNSLANRPPAHRRPIGNAAFATMPRLGRQTVGRLLAKQRRVRGQAGLEMSRRPVQGHPRMAEPSIRRATGFSMGTATIDRVSRNSMTGKPQSRTKRMS